MAIDGTHISIKAPKTNQERFDNRKDYYSLNYLIDWVNNANVLYIYGLFFDSSHDASVYSLSSWPNYIKY